MYIEDVCVLGLLTSRYLFFEYHDALSLLLGKHRYLLVRQLQDLHDQSGLFLIVRGYGGGCGSEGVASRTGR